MKVFIFLSAMFLTSSFQLEDNFKLFLVEYKKEMQDRNSEYLKQIHPNLPEDMHGFYFDFTQNIVEHPESEVKCWEFDICRLKASTPGNGQMNQDFIYHNNKWQVLNLND